MRVSSERESIECCGCFLGDGDMSVGSTVKVVAGAHRREVHLERKQQVVTNSRSPTAHTHARIVPPLPNVLTSNAILFPGALLARSTVIAPAPSSHVDVFLRSDTFASA
ncbi:hypothetical protein L484_007677 [Morus notabilis]|uniref:Uncharacterized protein n=1 Tax=Morus notabilis TaxID=981085 RepID=W9RQV6_9ROSA|nr:hypothetical protein L484_007677 [Morus notabilis]